MNIFVLVWRDPAGDTRTEEFDAAEFKVHTEPGWLKLHSKERGSVVRILPSDKVSIVQFGEKKEPSPIVAPNDITEPIKFPAS